MMRQGAGGGSGVITHVTPNPFQKRFPMRSHPGHAIPFKNGSEARLSAAALTHCSINRVVSFKGSTSKTSVTPRIQPSTGCQLKSMAVLCLAMARGSSFRLSVIAGPNSCDIFKSGRAVSPLFQHTEPETSDTSFKRNSDWFGWMTGARLTHSPPQPAQAISSPVDG